MATQYPVRSVGALDFAVLLYHLLGLFDGGRFAFDMGEDVGDLRHVVAHVGFKFGDLVVRALKGHALVEFDVLLDVKLAGEILDADVVDVQVVARGHGANAVEYILGALGAREGLDRNVSIGKNAAHCGSDGLH